MENKKQVAAIKAYMQKGETPEHHFLHGAELEYFIVDKATKKSLPFKNGIELILKELLNYGFQPILEAEHVIGIRNEKLAISLEPGAQWEISLYPQTNIATLQKVFLDFIEQLTPILQSRNQMLYSSGYLPKSTISEIEMLPKKRYRFMYDYFCKTGKYAHNMMKGTASIQVAVDYSKEEDFVQKMRLASRLTPIFSAIYDNSNVFEGEEYQDFCLRTLIWNHCDEQRCGIIPQIFAVDFGYEKYAEYILNLVPILITDKKNNIVSSQRPFKDVFDLNGDIEAQLNHVFSMCFPDVRARKYLELRMTDSLPYPLNFAFIELVYIIFYNASIFQKVHHLLENIGLQEIQQAKLEIIQKGIQAQYVGKTILEHFSEIMELIPADNLFQKWNQEIVETGIIPRFRKFRTAY